MGFASEQPVKMTVHYDQRDLEKVSIRLSEIKHDMPIDTAWATNRTLNYAKSLLAKDVNRRYRITQKDAKDSMSMIKANAMRPMGAIPVKGKPRALVDFRVTHPKKAAPKAAQLRDGATKPLLKGDIKAFFATMHNSPGENGENRDHFGVFQRQSEARLPIKQLYGSSVPTMIAGNKGIYKQAEKLIADRLAHNLETRVQYRIRKANSGGTWGKMAK